MSEAERTLPRYAGELGTKVDLNALQQHLLQLAAQQGAKVVLQLFRKYPELDRLGSMSPNGTLGGKNGLFLRARVEMDGAKVEDPDLTRRIHASLRKVTTTHPLILPFLQKCLSAPLPRSRHKGRIQRTYDAMFGEGSWQAVQAIVTQDHLGHSLPQVVETGDKPGGPDIIPPARSKRL
jgi:hypothetical protein